MSKLTALLRLKLETCRDRNPSGEEGFVLVLATKVMVIEKTL